MAPLAYLVLAPMHAISISCENAEILLWKGFHTIATNVLMYLFKLKLYSFQLGAKPEHVKIGYYLGDTDSCQGDSGGPLYKFVRGKAYLVGVVSRGDDCAGFNQPGIYTDVQKYKDWILEHTEDGSCR